MQDNRTLGTLSPRETIDLQFENNTLPLQYRTLELHSY